MNVLFKVCLYVFLSFSFFSCTSRQIQTGIAPDSKISSGHSPVKLSKEAASYIESVVHLMKDKAIHRQNINFDTLRRKIYVNANGAETKEDTHKAIKKALPLLQDHHSYFMTADEVRRNLGFTEKDIEVIKKGAVPSIEPGALDSLQNSLEYASAKMLENRVGYLVVPAFDNLFKEGMTLFADSLQKLIQQLDMQVTGWIIDLRSNDGGASIPMITGLGPLLDSNNVFYTTDESGGILDKTYYDNGGYYSVEKGEKKPAPIIRSKVNYRLNDPGKPIVLLTSFKTASSAEAVVAIFAGQPNVRIIGSKTNGLTSVNSFNFLKDNSVLNLTVGFYANRNRTWYKQGITPDVEVKTTSGSAKEPSTDIALHKGLEWIEKYGK